MPKLAFNFICKNERHVIGKMLASAADVTDLIVAVDTGSTDGTQDIIRQFGVERGIPTYVFERPFDNFANSRNEGIRRLKEVVDLLGWSREEVWAFSLDSDEVLLVQPSFRKDSLHADLYNIVGEFDGEVFNRCGFFHLSKPVYWYGPVHETLMCDEPITVGTIEGITFHSEPSGHSWKGNLEEKYLRYARLLESFLEKEGHSARWVYATATCFCSAAQYAKTQEAKDKWNRKALEYFKERVAIGMVNGPEGTGTAEMEMLAVAQYSVGLAYEALRCPWEQTQEAYFHAFGLDTIRGEAIFRILQHYQKVRNWKQAYELSCFAVSQFHDKSPLGARYISIEPALYHWQFLWAHYTNSVMLKKMEEARLIYANVRTIAATHPEYFSPSDQIQLKIQTPGWLSIQRLWKTRRAASSGNKDEVWKIQMSPVEAAEV